MYRRVGFIKFVSCGGFTSQTHENDHSDPLVIQFIVATHSLQFVFAMNRNFRHREAGTSRKSVPFHRPCARTPAQRMRVQTAELHLKPEPKAN